MFITQTILFLFLSNIARSLIRDWTDGLLSESAAKDKATIESKKKDMINLSINHSVVSQFTSFIAIEEREVSVPAFKGFPFVFDCRK